MVPLPNPLTLLASTTIEPLNIALLFGVVPQSPVGSPIYLTVP
ncbi:hypothetical protein C7M35_03102 (plasmid) [Lactiplantibacillus plantarum]|nr:hypothetical protein C7M35_03102 [Lactiplantibacillus plantarum]